MDVKHGIETDGNKGETVQKQRKCTIKNVAELAGVSPAIVSRVLNNDKTLQILPETKERVLNVVKEIGYRPNPIAKGLRIQKSGMIGFMLVDFTNPFYGPLIRGVQEPLSQEGYNCLLGETLEDPRKAMELVKFFLERQVDGVIVATATKNDPVIDYLESVGAKYVQLTRIAQNSRAPHVICDVYGGMRKVMEYLVDMGHTRIAHLAGHINSYSGEYRIKAYRDVLQENYLPVKEEYIVYADWVAENAGACMEQLLECEERPTAVVACNDIVAISAMSVIQERKLRVPEDISVAGFNNIQITEVVTPKLTTVSYPIFEMGCRASEILLDMINGAGPAESRERSVTLDTELVIRQSTGFLS